MKETLALFLSCAMLLCSLANFGIAVLSETDTTEQHHHELIRNLYDKVNAKDWVGYANCYAPSVMQDNLNMVLSEWNFEHKEDVLNIKHADDNRYRPDTFLYA